MRRNSIIVPILFISLLILGTRGKDITTSLQSPKLEQTNSDKPQTGNGSTSQSQHSGSSSHEADPEKLQTGTGLSDPSTGPPTDSGLSSQSERSGFGFSGFDSDWFNSFDTGFSTNYHSTVNCSEPNNPSLLFNVGTDGTGYPVVQINQEINNRPLFGQFLVMEVPGPIVVPLDPVFATANRTCPGVATNVFSFLSATRGPCWVLQGFQDPLFTVTCQLGDCVGCNSYSSSTTAHVGTTTIYKYRCIPQYESISVWAYCPLIGFPAIVREQVIVPSFCSCLQTPCTKTTTSTGW